jgi:predicted TIM-barrel fold metal-dependent hydrolase
MAVDLFALEPGSRREFGRFYPPRPEWLAKQAVEPVLEPELEIVDAHFHLVDLPGLQYLQPEFSADLDTGHRVVATVHAEAIAAYRTEGPELLRPVGETEFLVRQAAGDGRIASGIVGYADLMCGTAVEEVLHAHVAAGQGRFKGIRYALNKDPSPEIRVHHRTPDDIFEQPAFHAGLDVLEQMGLTFDAWAFYHQLPAVTRLAKDHPGLSIVMEHCGGLLGYGPYAGRRDEVFATWRASMAQLARCPNVTLKLGGTLGRLAAYDYLNVERPEPSEALARCLRPYILACIELFGPDRCMFESNYPVDAVVTGYRVLWNTFKRLTADFTRAEKEEMYAGTARRVYRLD